MVNIRKDIQGDTYMEKMEEQGIKKKNKHQNLVMLISTSEKY